MRRERPGAARRLVAVLAIVPWVGGCDEEVTAPAPRVDAVSVNENVHNVLSSVVTFQTGPADSARVRYRAPDQSSQTTPAVAIPEPTTRIVVLGLLPSVTYTYEVEVFSGNRVASSAPVTRETGPLPEELRQVRFVGTGAPSAGYTLLAPLDDGTVAYVLVFDAAGQVRWYRKFSEGVPARDVRQLENGDYIVFLGASHGSEPWDGRYVQFRPDGEVVASYVAAAPFYTDGHEMLTTFTGGAVDRVYLFGYDLRHVDRSALGGSSNELIAGHYILQQTASGVVEFTWSAWDHFQLADEIEPRNVLLPTDFDHPNSLDFDLDGNFIASWRNLAEVTKINAQTGAIMWRLGGRNNQFTFVNDPSGKFSAQHSARILDNGHLLLFDNGTSNSPQESRAVEYALDVQARTATLVWEYRHDPPVYTAFLGSVQRLRNGNTLVGFGAVGRATEVTSSKQVVWDARLVSGPEQRTLLFYRVIPIRSLYGYEEP